MPDFVYFERKCSISGTKSGLSVIRLMDPSTDLADATDEEMARMEWAWGMERGGLDYYLASAPNDMYLRDDIAEMFLNGDFLLLPTHKTYKDALVFREKAGYCDRGEDSSPLRPMTALGRVFRYVFIPTTDAAEELARRIPMQSLTDEDWNGGIHPRTGRPMNPHLRRYPVVESHCHLVSMCYFARIAFGLAMLHGWTVDIWDFTSCLSDLEEKWGIGRRSRSPPAPQWFVDSPMREDDDESLPESQQSGYWPLLGSKPNSLQHIPGRASLPSITDSEKSSRVLEWLKDLPQRKVLLRHSARLASTPTIPSSYASPARKIESTNVCKGFVPREEPEWSRQKGPLPTRQFTSNDWALFCFGTWLSEDGDGYTF
ncbi:uncharacterized protein SCHCODRAFT_02746994 [Schizophyllum commune H4-8]|nr:uncharacterized protein SCHCODRAFT_02746994 [Schizophyllum commune H4-8]KAI5895743.1 hypothetical protein SCHCODRAFT_02746994 [Schizophyllum commune H4-8]